MRLLIFLAFTILLSLGFRGADLVTDWSYYQSPSLLVARAQEVVPTEPSTELPTELSSDSVAVAEPTDDPVSSLVLEQFSEALNSRQAMLDVREEQLTARESLLQIAEDRLKAQEQQIVDQQKKLEQLLANLKQEEDEKLQRLVSIYSNMKPRNAAAIFNELEVETVLKVVKSMLPRKSSPILGLMAPERAREITSALSEETVSRGLNGIPADAVTN